MALREKLNSNKTAVVIGLILLIAGLLVWNVSWSQGEYRSPDRAFYSVDDGKTLFVDSASLIPPFEKEGKAAVKVVAMSCDGGATKTAVYLERYTQAAVKELSDRKAQTGSLSPAIVAGIAARGGKEVKKANDPNGKWVNCSDLGRAIPILTYRCPGGAKAAVISP